MTLSSQIDSITPDAIELTSASRTTYSSYRHSGVPWLGEIPAHWSVRPLKSEFSVINGATPRSDQAEYWGGDIAWITPEDLGALNHDTITVTRRSLTTEGYVSCGTRIAPIGSIVLSTRAPIGHVALLGMDACCNQGCRILSPRSKIAAKYAYYQLVAAREVLRSLGTGSTFTELNRDKVASFSMAVPDVAEQRTIAGFLDRETAKIDALVEKKERLIELLREKRAALISHAVTKGLDPDVPMKDSGVEWLGEVPLHWGIKRLKYVAPEVTVGIVVTPAKYYVDDGVPCLRSLNVREDGLRSESLVYISIESNTMLRKSMICKGDIVVVRTGQPGVAAVVDDRFHGANCIDLIIVRTA
jgi:type I restriction enzyme, S subunit